MLVRRLRTANWYTAEGVALKRAIIEKKGVPNMRYWRLITLTIDPRKFLGHCLDPHGDYLVIGYELVRRELVAYLAGKDRMRRFLLQLRDEIGDYDWCWKFEFQENGWPHWHLCYGRKAKLTETQLFLIEHFWGLGSTNVKMIRDGTLNYLFKYVAKEAFRNVEGETLPGWFTDHTVTFEGEMPATMTRVRFWQTSKGFYTGVRPEPRSPKEKCSTLVSFTVRENLDERGRKVRVYARSKSGKILKSTTLILSQNWKGGVDRLFAMQSVLGLAAAVGIDDYICRPREIQKLCLKHQKHRLAKVKARNRLSPEPEIAAYQSQLLLAQGIPF